MDAHFFEIQSSSISKNNNNFTLSTIESSHFIKSLRGNIGDIIWLLDGKGIAYKSKVLNFNLSIVTGKILSIHKNFGENNYSINLVISLIKGNRMNLIFEKATEYGVRAIFPIIMDRTIRKKINLKRSKKIVASAAKQTGRSFFPIVNELQNFPDWLNNHAADLNIACHMSSKNSIKKIITKKEKSVNIIIGPEGDFSENELLLIEKNNIKKVNLGNRRLRAETAAMTAIANINQIFEY